MTAKTADITVIKVMAIFLVPDSGLIQTGTLLSGELNVKHNGNGLVYEVVKASCNTERGYWYANHRNWIIFARFADQVLAEFEMAATRIEVE